MTTTTTAFMYRVAEVDSFSSIRDKRIEGVQRIFGVMPPTPLSKPLSPHTSPKFPSTSAVRLIYNLQWSKWFKIMAFTEFRFPHGMYHNRLTEPQFGLGLWTWPAQKSKPRINNNRQHFFYFLNIHVQAEILILCPCKIVWCCLVLQT